MEMESGERETRDGTAEEEADAGNDSVIPSSESDQENGAMQRAKA